MTEDIGYREWWVRRVRAWASEKARQTLPGSFQRRILYELGMYIRQARSGSTGHALALVALFCSGCDDHRLSRYFDAARKRYVIDLDRRHRGMERALLLLRRKVGNPGRGRRGFTEDQIVEAMQIAAAVYAGGTGYRASAHSWKAAFSIASEETEISVRTIQESIARRRRVRADYKRLLKPE